MSLRMIRSRWGMTLIEILTVVSIAAMLSAIAAPSAVQAMRAGAMNGTMSGVLEACHEARSLAVNHSPPRVGSAYACFGVVIVADEAMGGSFAAVTYGTADRPTPDDILKRKAELWSTWDEYQAAPDELDHAGNPIPVYRTDIPATFALYRADPDDMAGTRSQLSAVSWLFQHQTGALIAEASPVAEWIHIGKDPALLLQERYSNMGARFEIFPTGLIYSADIDEP